MTGCRGGTGSRALFGPGTGGKGLRRKIGTRILEMRQTDAELIAAKVVKQTKKGERALLLLPDGVVQILPPQDDKVRRGLQLHPTSLVGIYDAKARKADVMADVLEMSQKPH